jgi:hypothetical protein
VGARSRIASALVDILADDGAVVAYSGTWAGPGPETTWDGDWFLQGADGALAWSGDDVRLFGDAPERQGRVARRLGRPQAEGGAPLAGFASARRDRAGS